MALRVPSCTCRFIPAAAACLLVRRLRPASARYAAELERSVKKPVRGTHMKRLKEAQDVSLKIRKRT